LLTIISDLRPGGRAGKRWQVRLKQSLRKTGIPQDLDESLQITV
jgi:hypothetical protein